MKVTKRFNVYDKTNESSLQTVNLDVDPTTYGLAYPQHMRVTLLWLAEEYSKFGDMGEFNQFKEAAEAPEITEQKLIRWYYYHLSKDGDDNPYPIWSKLLSAPKPLKGRPPYSVCPRCEQPVWLTSSKMSDTELLEAFKADHHRYFCVNCGQRFKLNEYTGRLDYQNLLNVLKAQALAANQPSLDEVTV